MGVSCLVFNYLVFNYLAFGVFCSLFFTLCSLLFVLYSLFFALCSLLFALCSLFFALKSPVLQTFRDVLDLNFGKNHRYVSNPPFHYRLDKTLPLCPSPYS